MIWIKSGSPEVLQLLDVPKPVPKYDEALVRIHATTVSTADCQLRNSKTPLIFSFFHLIRPGPIILGQELAGEVEEVGRTVTRLKKGDLIFAWTAMRLGSYAEYTCLPEKGVWATLPAGLSYEEAAPLPLGGLEAAYFLRKADLQDGQKALIIGAGGSIGTFAVQIAKAFGAEVTGVDGPEKLDMLRSIGADRTVDYTREDFFQKMETYHVIFDVVGRSSFFRCIRMLAPGGRYLLANPPLPHIILGRLVSLTRNRKVIPWAVRTAEEYAEDAIFLNELIVTGKLKTIIDRTYLLEEIAEAHRYVEAGHKKGSVVVTVI